MIDFSKITKTVRGLDCHYFGQRTSGAQVIHRFVVYNNASEVICYYNEQGDEIEFSPSHGKWQLTGGYPIIASPKIVEVTGWVTLHNKGDSYCIGASMSEPLSLNNFLGKQKHTFRFEVLNE